MSVKGRATCASMILINVGKYVDHERMSARSASIWVVRAFLSLRLRELDSAMHVTSIKI